MRKIAYDNIFATDSQIIINYILISLKKNYHRQYLSKTDIIKLGNLYEPDYQNKFNIINLWICGLLYCKLLKLLQQ